MSDYRDMWKGVKKFCAAQNDDATKKLLKTFSKGLGPKLDATAAAFKKKDDANTKKHAKAALDIAKGYWQNRLKATGLPSKVDTELQMLKVIVLGLEKVAANGLAAGDIV